MDYVNCRLCPRQCGVDRTAGQQGYCGCPDTALVAKTMLHHWEEPVLAGSGGSGAIFFGGCRSCQNRAISARPVGQPADAAQVRQMMEDLIARGAENIDLVTPTQFLPTVLEALEEKLPVPVIYNCGGYETLSTVQALRGKVDIFLPDLKYADDALALSLSGVSDYFATATAAITQMVRQCPVAFVDVAANHHRNDAPHFVSGSGKQGKETIISRGGSRSGERRIFYRTATGNELFLLLTLN